MFMILLVIAKYLGGLIFFLGIGYMVGHSLKLRNHLK